MSIRAYKWSAVVLLCVVLLLAWRWLVCYRQMATAAFIDGQCATTQEIYIDGRRGPEDLALRLEFLMGYYDYYSRSLKGSPIAMITERRYQQTLTNAVIAFRSWTTNDLGSDPRAWIQKYGN